MRTKEQIPKPENETKLERAVRYWLNSKGRDYDNGWRGAYKDLEYGGCISGMVGKLIYYKDTVRFYKRHHEEIDGLLHDLLTETGESIEALFGDKWEKEDPLARNTLNQNLLAWFGFEETARRIAGANGYEV
jgi:hypothetical protein